MPAGAHLLREKPPFSIERLVDLPGNSLMTGNESVTWRATLKWDAIRGCSSCLGEPCGLETHFRGVPPISL